MDEKQKRFPVFYCVACMEPSYNPRPKIDFGKAGSYPLSVCGDCLRTGDESAVMVIAVHELISFVPPMVIEARMKEVLAEYRQPPQQGS